MEKLVAISVPDVNSFIIYDTKEEKEVENSEVKVYDMVVGIPADCSSVVWKRTKSKC